MLRHLAAMRLPITDADGLKPQNDAFGELVGLYYDGAEEPGSDLDLLH